MTTTRDELFKRWAEDFGNGPMQAMVQTSMRGIEEQWADSDWSADDIKTMVQAQLASQLVSDGMRAAFFAGMLAQEHRRAADDA